MFQKIFSKFKTFINIFKNDGFYALINFIFTKLKLPIYLNDFKVKNFDIFIKYLKIYDTGHELIRIGPKSDGGYLVPDILNEIDFCYSPGVGQSTLFEDQILKDYNIKCFLADGTVDNLITKHNFINKNIDILENEKTITLQNWIEKFSKNNNNLMLQMDIEGSEIEILYNLDINFLKKFKLLIIEFHDLMLINNKIAYNVVFNLFQKLNQFHTICHIHPNNMAGEFIFNSYRFPKLAEFTFIRNDLILNKQKLKSSLPHILDYKNYKSCPEIKLNSIFYS